MGYKEMDYFGKKKKTIQLNLQGKRIPDLPKEQMIPRPSTAFGGVFLFDFGNRVGKWVGNPKTRGMFDEWIHEETGDSLIIEADEDKPDEDASELWVHDTKGNHDSLSGGTYDEMIKEAHKFMIENPDGWE